MKILQILPELNIGGVERGTIDLARGLILNGHQAVVISNGGRLIDELEQSGAKHYLLPVHKKSLFCILLMIKKVADVIKKEDVDIVHARSRVPALIAYFACRKTDTKFITTAHGYYSNHFFSRVMGWGKRVIVPSQVISSHMIDTFKVNREKIRLIPRGVDLSAFKMSSKGRSPEQEIVIGIVGRISPIKGHSCFIRAVSRVIRKIPKLKVLIVGDSTPDKDNYKEEIKLLVRKLGLSSYVKFLGVQGDIPAILAKLNVLVMASLVPESFGRVLIEAGAVGVPAVATKVGGVVDIIDDGKTGLLVSPGNPEQMAAAIIRLIKDRNFAASLAVAAREKIGRQFSLDLMTRRTIKVYEEVRKETKILIIKFGAAGDLILAIPSFRAIRKRFPAGKITLLVEPAHHEIVRGCPYLDYIVVYDRKKKDRSLEKTLKLAGRLRGEDFDLVVDLQNNFRSHLISCLSCAPKRYGYNRGIGRFLLTDKAGKFRTTIPPLRHQLRVLNLLGITGIGDDLELWPTEEDEREISEFLSSAGLRPGQRLIGINPGSSKKWESKRWPLARFVELGTRLSRELGARVVITGQKAEQHRSRKLVSSIGGETINAVGKTSLSELACLIRHCQVFISGDSAPLHVAAAMDTRLVALFGPTDPVRHLPPGNNHILIRKDLNCSPCYRGRCYKHICMEEITVDEVFEAVKKQLRNKGKSRKELS